MEVDATAQGGGEGQPDLQVGGQRLLRIPLGQSGIRHTRGVAGRLGGLTWPMDLEGIQRGWGIAAAQIQARIDEALGGRGRQADDLEKLRGA